MTAFRADVIAVPVTTAFNGGGVNYIIQKNGSPDTLYFIFVDGNDVDVKYRKSVDGGLTWSLPVTIFTGTAVGVAVWYDRWSGIAADLIHVAYVESTNNDARYRSLDISSDTLGTETVIFDGASAASGGTLSITRTRGGNLCCYAVIDNGAEGGFFRSVDVGANWTSRTGPESLAAADMAIMMPGWAADNQDAMMFFWDASANEVSRYVYDDSANSWAETSIASSMVEQTVTACFPNFAAAVDITNSRNLLVAWSAVDSANADLRCWKITEAAITEVTNVVLNSTDDQALCGIGIDTDTEDWYVFYAGKSDGSETFSTSMNVYYKKSTDDGVTWGSETRVSAVTRSFLDMFTVPRFVLPFVVGWGGASASPFCVSVETDDGSGGGSGGLKGGVHHSLIF